MAWLYKPVRKVKQPDGSTVERKSDKWYVGYRVGGRILRKAAYTDKAASRALLNRIVQKAERSQEGYRETGGQSLRALVVEWQTSLLGKGKDREYAATLRSRVESVIRYSDMTTWADLRLHRVEAALAKLRQNHTDSRGRPARGISTETRNHHVQALKQFAAWVAERDELDASPLIRLKRESAKADRRHDRRALEPDEVRRLIDVAERGPEWNGYTGPDRSLVYRMAVETGLRANELATLTVGSFRLADDPPLVTVNARNSKHRRTDTLPLRQPMADRLAARFTGLPTSALAFNMPTSRQTAAMMRFDLARARSAWIDEAQDVAERGRRECDAFLKYRDDAGRHADFHALRATLITTLVRAGANVKDVQQLARHDTIGLTLDRYTTLRVASGLQTALAVLPDFGNGEASKTSQRATGTHGRASGDVANERPNVDRTRQQTPKADGAARRSARTGVIPPVSPVAGTVPDVAPSGTETPSLTLWVDGRETLVKRGDSVAPGHDMAPADTGNEPGSDGVVESATMEYVTRPWLARLNDEKTEHCHSGI